MAENVREIDLLIRGGILLAMSGDMKPVRDAVIAVGGSRIVFAGNAAGAGVPRFRAKETIDAAGSLILPGLVNTHTHAPMVAFRGMADDLPLMEWLQNQIFPAEARYVNRQMICDASRLAIAEMILSGTTTFCDAYFYESEVARAAMECGIRIVSGAGFIDFSPPGPAQIERHRETAVKYIAEWAGRSPLVTPAFFCHSPYTCAPETLRAVKEEANKSGSLFLTHVAETREEVEIIRQRYGLTPVRHLHNLGILDERTVIVHAVWVDDEEIGMLRDCGVRVSHCPESNMKLASGFCPLTKLIDNGVVVGLGTDGAASNNDMDMFGEMDKAAKVDKAARLDPAVMRAETVVRMATIDGAKVLGMDGDIGSIEPGKLADIILIDLKKPHLTPLYNPFSHIVYSASGADVSTVIIGGRVVMRERRLLSMDAGEAMERIAKLAETIKYDRGTSRFSA